MSDWTPQIVKIDKLIHHPDADALDVVTVLGDYPVIVKRDEYQEGDLAGYIPIDSIVPDTEYFHFLCPKSYEKYDGDYGEVLQRQLGPKFPVGSVPEKYRIIKAKKIRGTYSQGMLVNMTPWLTMVSHQGQCISNMPDVGGTIVDLIGLRKWEEENEDNIPNVKSRGTNAEKAPSGWAIPRYDIDGIRKYVDALLPNEEIVLTEKLNGSNAAFVYKDGRLWVKSRNYYKKMDPDDMWWDIAIRNELERKLSQLPNMVFFGEVYGQVKGFRYDTVIEGGALLTKVRFFDVWDLATMRYLDYPNRLAAIASVALDTVPELYRGAWLGKAEMYPFAEGLTMLGGKHIREGWVLNTLKERYEPRLDSRMQVKLVGEGYNLQK